MKMNFMAHAMWAIARPSFERNLYLLGAKDAPAVMKKAKAEYRRIIGDIPAFGKNDVLFMNLLSACTLAAVYRSLDEKPTTGQVERYYDAAMAGSSITTAFLKRTDYYSKGYQNRLKKTGEKSQKSDNPYSWRFTYHAGETLDSFDAVFDRCGICHLFKELGMAEVTPAMCAYDYGMAKLTNTCFTREFTLASGGPACDCHYKKKQ